VLAFLACLLLEYFMCSALFRRHSPTSDGTGLLLVITTGVAIFGFALLLVAWRIMAGKLSANGRTLLPTWFIQAFGAVMFVSSGMTSYLQGPAYFLLEGLMVFLAMIVVGKRIDAE
jgi:hypothetical protein